MTRKSDRTVSVPAGHSGLRHPPAADPIAPSFPPLREIDVTIETADGIADAYFVHPSSGAHPGVLVWPDAMSIRPAFRSMAKRLAGSGYSVLVINPYYRMLPAPIGVDAASFNEPAGREKVMRLVETITPEMTLADARALVGYLNQQASVDNDRKLGVIGYCMGGGMALATASIACERVGAVASFHGSKLVTPAEDSPHRLVQSIEASALIAIAEDDDERDPHGQGPTPKSIRGKRIGR